MAYNEKITFEVNLNNINKDAVRKVANGQWLKMTIVPTPESPYSEYMVTQYVKGEKGPILGNGSDLNTVLNKINGGGSEESKEDAPMPF